MKLKALKEQSLKVSLMIRTKELNNKKLLILPRVKRKSPMMKKTMRKGMKRKVTRTKREKRKSLIDLF
jgi:cobyric acid synthase